MIEEIARVAETLGPIEVGMLMNDTDHFDADMSEYARLQLRSRDLIDDVGLYTSRGRQVRAVLKDMGRVAPPTDDENADCFGGCGK